ncbi:MAG: TauD/TfdA family dioxygenase [Betaproteobacteria bacterium]|nr:TauD/TfdA family dioxygenase [Betaproteobacteria bacterium]
MDEILRAPVNTSCAWIATTFSGEDSWIDRLSGEEILEIDKALEKLRVRGLCWPNFTKKDFEIPALGAHLQKMLAEIREGRGFVLIRGIPVERYNPEQSRNIYWGIGAHLGEIISQNAKGDLIGEVTNLGADYTKPNVRGYTTRDHLRPHCDSADVVGLFCIKQARSGGMSSIASSIAIYNAILREHPEYIEPLYSGFHYDLRGEGVTGHVNEVTRNKVPVFSYFKGHLSCRFNPKAIETAQIKMGRSLSSLELDAVHHIEQLASDPTYRLDMMLEPGDIQLIDNYSVLHSRTEYIDHDEPDEKRLLLRLWINIFDGRELAPNFSDRYNTGSRRGVAALKAGMPS